MMFERVCYNLQMGLLELFPSEITVTDQVLDISNFSLKWKKDVIALAERILFDYKKSAKQRFVVAIAGASGSSKSITAAVIEKLLNKLQAGVYTVSIGQDGYHFYQDYLLKTLDKNNEPLANHKGRYDSFDVVSFKNDLESFIAGEKISFPSYSRKIHNPVPKAVTVDQKSLILVIDGHWLLYNEKPWSDLLVLYDLTVFFHATPMVREKNTITRHIRGNEHSPEKAKVFYKESDEKNSELIINNIAPHDFDFYLDE